MDQTLDEISTPKAYPSRPGATDSGRDYEFKIGALLFLRCITLKNTKHAWLAMNVDQCGAFDDVILHRRTNDGNEITYLIQLKHSEKGAGIRAEEFKTKKNSPFLLAKYFESIREIYKESAGEAQKTKEQDRDEKVKGKDESKEEKNKSKDQEQITMEEKETIDCMWRNRKKIVFVLFTNRGTTPGCNFLQEVTKKSTLDAKWLLYETIDTGGKVSQFDYEKLNENFEDDVSEFMERFFLFANQLYVDKLDGAIKNAMKSFIQPVKVSEGLLTDVVTKFVTFITEWSKGLLGGCYPLTKTLVLKKVLELILEPNKIEMNNSNDNNIMEANIWDDITSDKDVILIQNVDDLAVRFVTQSVHNIINKQLKNAELKKALKQNINEQALRVVCITKDISYEDVYEILWKTSKIPLLLQVDSRGIKQLQKILKMSRGIIRVVIFNKSETNFGNVSSSSQFVNIGDLKENNQKIILEKPVKLQGRASASFQLNDFVNKKLFKLLTVRDIIYILSDKINIGGKFESLPEFFIQQSLKKVWLQNSVLTETMEDVFVIKCNSAYNFQLFLKTHNLNTIFCQWENINNNSGAQIVIFEDKDNLEDIEKYFSKKVSPVHFLSLHTTNNLEWLRSYGTTTNIRIFRSKSKVTNSEENLAVKELVETLCNKRSPVLVSANPGMGKTILISYMAHSAPTNFWVMKINLAQHKEQYKHWNIDNLSTQPSKIELCLTKFIEHVLGQQKCDKDLCKAVFEKYLKSKSILFLLDGFDEIPINYQSDAKNLIKYISDSGYPLCLTTRPLFKIDLESLLDIFAVDLELFSKEDQIYYLTNYFAKSVAGLPSDRKVISFVRKLLGATKQNLYDHENEFLGVPLQTTLLAEVFVDDFKQYFQDQVFANKHFDLLYLYKHFIEKKIKIACSKMEGISEDTIHQYKMCRSFYALRVLFSPLDLQDIKIDEKINQVMEMLPFMSKLIQKDGIVTEDDSNVTFVHRTFGEYLAAEWLADNLNTQHRKTVRNLYEKTFDPNLALVRNIFDRMLAKNCPLHLAIINRQVNAIKEIVAVANIFTKTDLGKRSFLHLIAAWGLHHPVIYIEDFIAHKMVAEDDMVVVLNLIPNDKLEYTKDELLGYTQLEYAIASGSLNIANAICSRLKGAIHYFSSHFTIRDVVVTYCSEFNYSLLYWLLFKYSSVKSFEKVDQAAINGNVETVRSLISNATNIDEKDDDGSTPLHIAAKYGHTEEASTLLSNKAEVNARDNDGKTPLHWASIEGHIDVVALLILNSANLNAKDLYNLQASNPSIDKGLKPNMTALHWAAYKGQLGIAELLISKGADLEIRSVYDMTALHFAAQNGQTDVINLLLEKGADTEAKDAANRTALHLAAVGGYTESVLVLLSKGADVEAKDNDYGTPLHLAAYCGHTDTIELLLANGAKIEGKDYRDRTALHFAIWNGHTDAVNLLSAKDANVKARYSEAFEALQRAVMYGYTNTIHAVLLHGADVQARDGDNKTLLHFAAYFGHTDTVKLLLSKGAHTEAKNNKGYTCLHLAAHRGHLDIVKVILNNGAYMEAKNDEGRTALHCPTFKDQTNVIDVLLPGGCKVDVKDCHGNTILHFASYYGHLQIIKLLVSLGADLEARDNENCTALYLAAIKGHADTVKFLLSRGAKTDVRSTGGYTVLHRVTGTGSTDMVKLLVCHGVDVDARDSNDGNTAVYIAAEQGKFDTLNLLLTEGGANLEIKNNEGYTPLIAAVAKSHTDIIELLIAKGVNLQATDDKGKTALHWATILNRKDIASLLLTNGANIEAKNNQNFTALHFAAYMGHTDVIDVLFSRAANIETNKYLGSTPLHCASYNGHLQTVKLLLQLGADLEAKDNENYTPLHLAAINGHADTVKFLLSRGAKTNVRSTDGYTVLHRVTGTGSTDMVKLLVCHGVDVDARDSNDGNTAVYIAAHQGKFDTLNLLLTEGGANLEIKNNNGYTPLILAVATGHTEIIELLIVKGVNLEATDNKGNTALHWATIENQRKAAHLLLKHGANVEAKTEGNRTALHVAALKGLTEIVELLLIHESNLEAKDNDDRTPLHYAVVGDYSDIVKFLLSKGADAKAKDNKGLTALDLAKLTRQSEILSIIMANTENC